MDRDSKILLKKRDLGGADLSIFVNKDVREQNRKKSKVIITH